MSAYTTAHLPEGAQLLQLTSGDIACRCNATLTHLVIQHRRLEEGNCQIHARGFCDACSPHVVRRGFDPLPAPQSWWRRLLQRAAMSNAV